MLMNSSLKDKVIEVIETKDNMFAVFDNIYLFGSILRRESVPNDIDILCIYSCYPDKLVEAVNAIRAILEMELRHPIDLTVLSVNEEKDVGFLKRLNFLYLKLK